MFRLLRPLGLTFKRYSSSVAATGAPNLLQYKVGKIINVQDHPDADKLYVSKVSVDESVNEYSEAEETPGNANILTICSGLRLFVAKQEMLGTKIVLVNNLKSSKMRGIKSEAMLLAAEKEYDEGDVNVELVKAPLKSKLGASLVFRPLEPTAENEAEIPQQWKKIKDVRKLSTIMAGIRTGEDKFVAFPEKYWYLVDPEVHEAVQNLGKVEIDKKDYIAFVSELGDAAVR